MRDIRTLLPSQALAELESEIRAQMHVWWPLFQTNSPLEEIRALFFDRVDRTLNQALLDWCESQRSAVQECYGL